MKSRFPVTGVIMLISSASAFADNDCTRPMDEWQPREAVVASVSAKGITPDRLRIDDGCYKVHGRDSDGNLIKLKIDPSTLSIMKLEVRFLSEANAARYFPDAQAGAVAPVKPDTSRPRQGRP